MIDEVAYDRVEALVREVQLQSVALPELCVADALGFRIGLAKRLVVGGVLLAPAVDADEAPLRIALGTGDRQRSAPAAHVKADAALRQLHIPGDALNDLLRHLPLAVVGKGSVQQLSLMTYTSHSQKVSREKSYDSIAKIVRLAYNRDEPNLDEKEESYMSITATELKQNLSKYLLMAEREDVFITRNGKVVAKLTNPYQDRVDMAKSLFGIIPGDMTIEQAHSERLDKV